ncbi:MAG: winged helix-turn-helix domain-containing protein [Bdellovibrio sp.]
MTTNNNHLLELALLHYLKGDFRESRKMAVQCGAAALQVGNKLLWCECTRFIYQCSIELEELHLFENIYFELLATLNQPEDERVHARCNCVLGMWSLSKKEMETSAKFLNSAVSLALQVQELETLCRSLFGLAVQALYSHNYKNALELLDKTEVLAKELKHSTIEISCMVARSQIYVAENKHEQALELLWRSLERSRLHGYSYSSANVLALLAKIYSDLKDQDRFKIYGEMSHLGISAERYPRLYRFLQNLLPNDLVSFTNGYDIILDEGTNMIKECRKGSIDFHNQHILFDLAQNFIRNPGRRFAKEELIKSIWQQEYLPQVHDNLVYVSIKRLRALLEQDPESPRYIVRDRKGYFLPEHFSIKIQTFKEKNL